MMSPTKQCDELSPDGHSIVLKCQQRLCNMVQFLQTGISYLVDAYKWNHLLLLFSMHDFM